MITSQLLNQNSILNQREGLEKQICIWNIWGKKEEFGALKENNSRKLYKSHRRTFPNWFGEESVYIYPFRFDPVAEMCFLYMILELLLQFLL